MIRSLRPLVLALSVLAATAGAQAPPTSLVVLLLPSSTRAAALGDAWVAGRDDYSIFYNPAQLAPTTGIGGSFARYAPSAVAGAVTYATTVGATTFGWGVQLAQFEVTPGTAYPLAPASVAHRGGRDGQSFVATAAASRLFKGFRTGVAVKFAEDRVDAAPPVGTADVVTQRLLADVGVSHPLRSGTAALAVQHLDDGSRPRGPLQVALGYARQFQAGPLDVGVTTQAVQRQDWFSPAGGVEVGYGWIEGYSATLRAGARRAETSARRPVSLGAGLTADRLVLDYAVEFFAGDRYAHHLALRWR